MTTAVFACTESAFDIFAQKPVQAAIIETIETLYKLMAKVDQSDLQFLVPGGNGTYTDLNIHVYVKGKLIKPDGTDFDVTDYTTFVNNSLHSIFSSCSVTLNGVSMMSSENLYPYRSYLQTLLTNGSDAATSHLTKAFWYLNNGNMIACKPDDTYTADTNMGT